MTLAFDIPRRRVLAAVGDQLTLEGASTLLTIGVRMPARACDARLGRMSEGVSYSWRDPISDDELVALVEAHGGRSEAGWWDRVSPRSLGWVSARGPLTVSSSGS